MRGMRDVAGPRHRSHIAADNSSMARSLEPMEALMTKSTDQPCILTLNASDRAFRGRRILYVEDNEDNVYVITKRLTRAPALRFWSLPTVPRALRWQWNGSP